ncbi:uncharacterized protein LOC125718411 [Brienomyrus brachyistius]|uniref:uncharacterized protein LOC125718411 n=1 Tax=Brienomyrus brachyistius TaxID=42636 RepID=UPI0020B2050D|nr:uncharacterized protein LOC125718411 [Brienomyrus brachyistius]
MNEDQPCGDIIVASVNTFASSLAFYTALTEMDFAPLFRFEHSGELTLRPSLEALATQRALVGQTGTTPSQAKDPAAVLTEARSRVAAQGGDPRDQRLVASECAIQFGQYRGKTFKWLLSNDVGYSAMVLAEHQAEKESGNLSDTAAASGVTRNKDVFLRYASSFPQMSEVIRRRRHLEAPSHKTLVGFGAHKNCTYKELYESKDRERRSYVRWVRGQSSKPGTRMDVLKKYIQMRDAQQAPPSSAPSEVPLVVPGSSKEMPTTAPESSDAELLTCAVEHETSGESKCIFE